MCDVAGQIWTTTIDKIQQLKVATVLVSASSMLLQYFKNCNKFYGHGLCKVYYNTLLLLLALLY